MKINKKLSILSLLIISPSLMAAYSRYTSLDQYYDLSFTVECLGELDEGYKTYEFTIKNTGKGYIPYYEAFKYKASGFGSTSMNYQDDHLFGYSGLIAPNKEFIITYKTNSEFTQFEEGSFSTYAYKNS